MAYNPNAAMDVAGIMTGIRDTYRQSRGNTLYKMAVTGEGDQRKSALAELAGLNPNAARTLQSDFDEKDKADFADWAVTLDNVAPELQPEVYKAGVARFGDKFRRMGIEPPQDYKQALPAIRQWAGGGMQPSQDPAAVREIDLIADRLGLKRGTPKYAQFVKTQYKLEAPAANWRYGETPSGLPNRYRGDEYQVYNPATKTWDAYGGEQAAGPQGGQPISLEQINQIGARMRRDGGSVEEVNAWKDQQYALWEMANGMGNSGAIGPTAGQAPPPAAGPAPVANSPFVKPEAPKPTYRPATPQEKAAYGIAADVPARIDSTGKVEPITVPKTGMEKTPAQIEAEQRKKTAQVEMSRVLKLMLDEYKTLNDVKGITNTERSWIDNVGSYARASDTGQVIGRITGTTDQSARDTINQLKPQVLSAVMAASGMSAKQLDSNAEMKLWLSAVTDPQTSYQTVIKVTDNLLKKFTGQGIDQFKSGGSKPPAQPPAGKRVGRFVIEEN